MNRVLLEGNDYRKLRPEETPDIMEMNMINKGGIIYYIEGNGKIYTRLRDAEGKRVMAELVGKARENVLSELEEIKVGA